MGQTLGGIGGVLGLGNLLAGAGLAGTIGMLREVARSFAEINDTALQAGVSAEALQELRFAIEQSGGSAEAADSGITRFAKNVSEAAQGGADPAKAISYLERALQLDPESVAAGEALAELYASPGFVAVDGSMVDSGWFHGVYV